MAHPLPRFLLDDLTGVASHAVAPCAIKRLVTLASISDDDDDAEVVLIYWDICRFAWFNCTHGHDVGDRLFRLIGQTLSRQINPDTQLLARSGGGAFLLVCAGISPAAAEAFARRGCEAVTVALEAFDGAAEETGLRAGVAYLASGDEAAVLANELAEAAGMSPAEFREARLRPMERVCVDLDGAVGHAAADARSGGVGTVCVRAVCPALSPPPRPMGEAPLR
jgi:diguanylate cyclase (GGDEF)-like protein